jgi:hypothetical protein
MAASLQQPERQDFMKVLIASTRAMGHINPLLAIGRILIAAGQRSWPCQPLLCATVLKISAQDCVRFLRELTSTRGILLQYFLKSRPRPRGPKERAWPSSAPSSIRFPHSTKAYGRRQGLRQVLQDFPADIIIGDDFLFGALPMLLGPRSERPPIVLCGTSILHWHRDDGAPHFAALPPASNEAERREYAALVRRI